MELWYVFPYAFVGFDSTVFWASSPNGNIFVKNDDLTDLRLQIVGFGVCCVVVSSHSHARTENRDVEFLKLPGHLSFTLFKLDSDP
jgi:hypothetical protein